MTIRPSQYDLIQRVFDDALRASLFQSGNDCTHGGLIENRVHGNHSPSLSEEIVGFFNAGNTASTFSRSFL